MRFQRIVEKLQQNAKIKSNDEQWMPWTPSYHLYRHQSYPQRRCIIRQLREGAEREIIVRERPAAGRYGAVDDSWQRQRCCEYVSPSGQFQRWFAAVSVVTALITRRFFGLQPWIPSEELSCYYARPHTSALNILNSIYSTKLLKLIFNFGFRGLFTGFYSRSFFLVVVVGSSSSSSSLFAWKVMNDKSL